MDIAVLSIAVLAASGSTSSTGPAASGLAATEAAASSPARRSSGGATAIATVTVRIISSSARIGPGAPPMPDMVPRASTIAATDGSHVPALIYDFE